jgi:TolB-like protein
MESKMHSALLVDDSTHEAIRSQLNRILASQVFRDSSSAKRFLRFVVETVLAGKSHLIKQYTIAVEALGYPEDFDPHTSTAMRVLASRLRIMLDRYYLHEGENDDILIEIPKQTYIPIFRSKVISPKNKVGSTIAFSHVADLSIAVIPFENQAPHERDTYTTNVTESIITGLSQFSELHIIGPLLVYQNRSVDPTEVGRRYNARFVLQGHILMQGSNLRAWTNLTDTRNGFSLWSQTYEYTLNAMTLPEIEHDISRCVVTSVADYSGIIPNLISRESMKKNPDDLEVYEAIYRHQHFLKVFTKYAHHAAIEALEQAVKMHEDDSVALAMLSNAYCYNYLFDLGRKNAPLEKAERLVQQSLAVNPECQIAIFTDALLQFFQGQSDRCIAKLMLATSSNPFNQGKFILHRK